MYPPKPIPLLFSCINSLVVFLGRIPMLEEYSSTSRVYLSLCLCVPSPSSSHYPFATSSALSLAEMPENSIASSFLSQAACHLEALGVWSGWLCVGDTASPACCILGNLLKYWVPLQCLENQIPFFSFSGPWRVKVGLVKAQYNLLNLKTLKQFIHPIWGQAFCSRKFPGAISHKIHSE